MSKKETITIDIRCSFCGKRKHEVEQLITGMIGAAAICNECVATCESILFEEKVKKIVKEAIK